MQYAMSYMQVIHTYDLVIHFRCLKYQQIDLKFIEDIHQKIYLGYFRHVRSEELKLKKTIGELV